MDENGEWRILYNEKLHSFYRLPNVVRVIKPRKLTWASYVTKIGKARVEEGRSAFKMLTGKTYRIDSFRNT